MLEVDEEDKGEDGTHVVPVALSLGESGGREAEGTLPGAGLGGILGQRKLALVAVPVTDEVDGLAVGGGAESEAELNGRHFDCSKSGIGYK